MKASFKLLGTVAAFAIAASTPAIAAHHGPTDADLIADASSTGDVLTYGMGPEGQRFSPLKTLNSTNISKLVPLID